MESSTHKSLKFGLWWQEKKHQIHLMMTTFSSVVSTTNDSSVAPLPPPPTAFTLVKGYTVSVHRWTSQGPSGRPPNEVHLEQIPRWLLLQTRRACTIQETYITGRYDRDLTPSPLPLHIGKAGRIHMKEEIIPLLPTGSQTISNLGHAALLRRCELPYKWNCWTNSGAL